MEKSDPAYVTASVNPVTMKDIKILSPNYPLAEYMENYGWSKSKLINLGEPEWLTGLNELYTEENLEGIKAYILFHSIGAYISIIDEEAYREYQRISNEASGTTENMPDTELAYSDTRGRFSNCFGRIYKEKYLTEEI